MQPPVLGGYDCIWVSASIIQFENFYFMERPRAVITGVGAYYPDYILTNEELSRMVDTTDEWIHDSDRYKRETYFTGCR